MKLKFVVPVVLSALAPWPLAASAQTTEPVNPPPAAGERTLSPDTALIVPLAPPDEVSTPAAPEGPVFSDFQYDDDVPERELDVVLHSLFESNDVSGPGKAASFLEPGEHWLHDLEVNARAPLGERWRAELSAVVRYTDTRRYDPAVTSLQRLQFTASDDVHHVSVGDYYATLSQYSLNRVIKGVGYQRSVGEGSYVRFVAGSFDPRWDYVFDDKDEEPIDRHVAGLRAQTAGDGYRVGLNLVTAQDRNDDPVRTSEDTFRQVLPALDWEYRTAPGVWLSGEHAMARTERQSSAGETDDLYGTAHRLNFDGSLGKLRLRARTERVSPDFFTMGGGAAVDRARTYARGDYRFSGPWSVFAAGDWYRNNLDDQLDATTRTVIAEVGVNARGLFERRTLNLVSSLRQRRVDIDGPEDQESIGDRIYLSLSDRFGEVSLRGEAEALINERKGLADSSNDDFLYRVTVDSRHLILGRFDLRPYLALERQELEDPTTGDAVRTDGLRLDVRLLTPGDLYYGFSLEDRRTDNAVPGADDSRLQRIGVNLNSRPRVLRGGSFNAEAGYADYGFSDQDKDYQERYIRLMLDIPFSKGS